MSEITKLIEIAKAEEGYLEKKTNSQLDSKTANAGSGNYTKYARDLDNIKDFYNGKKNGYAWCDVFVDWCFVQAFGVDRAKALLLQPNKSLGAGCTYSKKYYKNNNQYHSTPKVGDQIFFKNSSGSVYHTGLVIDVDSKKVYTIEGNTSSAAGVVDNGGCVRIKSYTIGYKYIDGYGRPNFNEEVKEEKEEPKANVKYIYNCTSLNVRKMAGTKYKDGNKEKDVPIVKVLPKGTKVTVYEVSNGWSRIGKDQWVSNNFLSSSKNPAKYPTKKVNTQSLRIRNKPSTDGKVLGYLQRNAKVTIYETNGSWVKISPNSSRWVSNNYLK